MSGAAGAVHARRHSDYSLLKMYADGAEDDDSPLDHVTDAEARFGSYKRLTASAQFRFVHPQRLSTPVGPRE